LEATGIALYVDIENLIGGAMASGLPIDLSRVITKLKETGPIRVRKCYGDIPNATWGASGQGTDIVTIRRMLHRNLFEIVDVPYTGYSAGSTPKNGADITMAVDVVETLFQNPGISHYAILSSDRDFVPLFSKINQHGKTVIAIAVDRNITNPMLTEAASLSFYYSDLFEVAAAGTTGIESGVRTELREECFDLMAMALRAIDARAGALLGTTVNLQMRTYRSDFTPQMAGYDSFKSFALAAAEARSIRAILPTGPGDFQFILPAAKVESEPSPATPRSDEDKAREIRMVFEAILKTSFPKYEKRRLILDEIHRSYDDFIPNGPFNLQELTNHAQASLSASGQPTEAVFKMGLSLYFSRCFNSVPSGHPNNPQIVGLAQPFDFWEDRIHENLIRNSRRRLAGVPPQVLALALYDSADHAEQVEKCARWMEEHCL